MVVFKFRSAFSLEQCQQALQEMEIPGKPIKERLSEDDDSTIVWKDDKFIGIHYGDTQTMELYATKNTNSVQYFEKRYPKLEYDRVQLVKTKRW